MLTQGRAVGTRLGMYVLHILKTKQNKAFVLTVQENFWNNRAESFKVGFPWNNWTAF